jgi:CheY-like chemotaxis protein
MNPSSPTILLADDDEGHVILITENLRMAGVDKPVLSFGDGRDLLDFLHGVHPRHRLDPAQPLAVLMDVRMPRMDGVETLRRIKGDARLKRLPVIMLTTADDPNEVNRCHDLGCACYVVKPVDYTQFAQNIQALGRFLISLKLPRLNQAIRT